MTSRELVIKTLEFKNTSGRVPRQLWSLPWANDNHPGMIKKLSQDFEWDFGGPDTVYEKYPDTVGNPYENGEYVDEWGCRFINIQKGVIGEVKNPIVAADDEEWSDTARIHIPEKLLTFDIQKVNESCKKSDKFIMAAACPRPFEQLQFIRSTQQLYMDLMDRPPKMVEFMEKMHDFYCRLLTRWAQTEVDALNFMDDWGSQRSLLINPKTWVEIFKPMYKDYIGIAHKYGKKIFMHSDGFTLDIIPHLIELGLDALNAQIFCIGIENLKQFRGYITFWGEIDRQNLLPKGSISDIDNAVQSVYDNLWKDGGVIAQCEFGAGANPDNVYRVFEKWSSIR